MTATVSGLRCPTCGRLGIHDGTTDMYCCDGAGQHRFWAATRRCSCGDVPVVPVGGDTWVCVNCGLWEAVS